MESTQSRDRGAPCGNGTAPAAATCGARTCNAVRAAAANLAALLSERTCCARCAMDIHAREWSVRAKPVALTLSCSERA